ncbi:Zinc finger, RING-type [Corchorus olitorius]|uniref:Zinc finger, RING-type n=1 Tax=Corchorus olitorius TaxID=93759 RepID=A0A1R3KR17_9ROSI|nr:Zinc finger, RING-type [Corchorus olitorius]
MATSDDQTGKDQRKNSRLGFLRNPNRQTLSLLPQPSKVRVIDGNKLFKAVVASSSSSAQGGSGTTSSSHTDSEDKTLGSRQQLINKPVKAAANGVAAKTTASSRIRAYWNALKNGKKTQTCQIPRDLIKIKETPQVSNHSAAVELVNKKNIIGTTNKRVVASSKEKKETVEPPKDRAGGLVKKTAAGNSKIPSPKPPCKLKKETTKDSAASLVKKKSRIPEQKLSLSQNTELLLTKQLLGLLSKYKTDGAGPSNLLSEDKESIDDEYYHHIEWEGFDEDIEPYEMMTCHLCEGDIAEEAEYDPEIERVNPAVTAAVLSCGHVFHCHCLEYATPEDNSTDPPCMICISLSS